MKRLNTRALAVFLAALMSIGFASAQTPNWHLVPEKAAYPKGERVVAGFTVNPATWGNGATDCTNEIQAMLYALDKAGNRGQNMWNNMELLGGGVLYMPEGKYRIDGQLIIPKGVTIRGDWKKPVKGQPIQGTIITTNHGRGVTRANTAAYENASFIIMQSASALMDVAIHYPQQDANNIQPYAPTVLLGHRGGPHGNEFNNVKNVTLVNSYDGVVFSQIGGTCYTINGLYGTPLNIGVEIDRIVDIGRAEHISFSPMYWAYSGLPGAPNINNATFRDHLYNNATGIMMRRNDWSYTLYLDVEGYNKGFWAALSLQQDGADGLATPNGQNYGFNFSNCKYGIYHESSTGQGSVMYSEVKMAGVEYGMYFTEKSSSVSQLYKGEISATKCAIYADPASSTKFALMESTIKAGKVLMQGGTLLAVNNQFNNPRPQIEFEANSRGNVIGNQFSQPVEISQNSVFKNVIDHGAIAMEPHPDYIEFIPRATKQAGPAFIVVNTPKGHKDNFPANAAPTVADATNAIQTALNNAAGQGGGIVYLPPGHYRIDGQLTIPSGVELKGSTDVSSFPVGPGSVLEIYNRTSVAVVMEANSGMRGMNFNYPEQVYCTVMPNPIDFPFSVQGRGENIYIVNTAMRQSNRGVDLQSYSCDNFYIDFLTGYFFREGVNIKNSKNGVLANMQCNTIVYNSGSEVKFGQYPNSNREPVCADDDSKNPYTYNSRYMTFLTMEDVEDILLYGDFNYNALVGMHVKDNVSGTALGFALDDDRTMLYLDGENIQLDFINLQGVALQRENDNHPSLSNDVNSPNYGKSTYIRSSDRFTGEVNLFSSAYWGYAGESGLLLNGEGVVNIYGGYFQHAGENSFANVNDGDLNLIGSVVNPPNGGRPTYTGNGGNVSTIGSVTNDDNSVTGDKNLPLSPEASTSGALNNCNTWTATAVPNPNGQEIQNIVDCNMGNSWNSGWQNASAPSGNMLIDVTVDMKSNQTFNQVILDYGSAAADGPETYRLSVSTDGINFIEVASGSGRNSAMTMISFPTQTARYVRVTKPASNTANYWAIDNLYVVTVASTDINTIAEVDDGTPEIGEDIDDEPVAVTGVSMANVSVAVGSTVTLAPVVTPSNADNKNVTFAVVIGGDKVSLNATTGLVTGVAEGTATVSATTTDGGFTATATVTVNALPVTVSNEYCYDEAILGGLAENTGNHIGQMDKPDSFCEWTVDGGAGGTATVTVTYATAVENPSFGVSVNGGATANHSIVPTDNWEGTYPGSDEFTVTLNAGDNTIRLTTPSGGVNVRCITVVAPGGSAPACNINIAAQPQSKTYTVGDAAASLAVTATGENLSYIWYKSADNSTATPANDMEVSVNAGYVPEVAVAGASYYFVKISDGDCEKLSNVATITVNNSVSVGDPVYPAGYPKTMAMQNPLFWQFGSEQVSNDDAGTLVPGSNGNLYTADPSAHVWNINGEETLFVYASHDMEAARGCDRMDRYHVFSTTDMVNWTDYGEILNASQVPWHTGAFRNGSTFMWAPDCVYKNGKYYFYFPHPSQNSDDGAGSWGNNWKIGVAVSDHPASGFEILPTPLTLNTGYEYDPCVFVDDDQQAYLYYGGGSHPYVVKLKDNMTEIDGTPQVMEGLNNFHEGIWVHKYNGKYYLSYPDNGGGGANMGDQLKYAVSDSPTGPWESIGAYVYATGCGTIHGSIVEFKDQWYAFYHSDYISHNGDQGRTAHVDKLYYNTDGTIQVVNNWGSAYNGPHNVPAVNNTTTVALTLQAEDFNTGGEIYGYHDTKSYTANPPTNPYRGDATGVVIEPANGGYVIGDITNREFLRYTIQVEKAGLYDVDCYVSSASTDGRFHLNVNGVNKSGSVNVPNRNGWGNYQPLTVSNVPLKAGENLFELRVEQYGFNIDRFEFRGAQAYSGTPFNGPHNVPGKVEAEDFDNGAKNVAWFDNDDANQSNSNYRPGTGVDLEITNGGGVNMSWTGGDEWTKYTLNVTETGIYDVNIRVSTGNGASGSLSLIFDDVYEYPSVQTTTPSWGDYAVITLKGVELTQGTHRMQMTIGGNINVDWYEFVKAVHVPVTNVEISPKIETLTEGQTIVLSAIVSPNNATNQNVVYTVVEGEEYITLDNNVVTAIAEGAALVRATTIDGALVDDATIVVTTVTGTSDLDVSEKDIDNVSVYPNPSTGIFNVDVPKNATIQVYDSRGIQVNSGSLFKGVNVVDMQAYPAGIYYATVTFDSKVMQVKLVKR